MLSSVLFGQNTASIGISFINYQPLCKFRELPYHVGYGAKFDFLSKKRPVFSALDYQIGAHMDFGAMGRRDFHVELNVPNPDVGTMSVRNSTYGFFGKIRFIPSYDANFKPYAELFLGHRNFNTKQVVIANNPDLNPDYESYTTDNKVVFTKRFNVGASLGFRYRTSQKLAIESSCILNLSPTMGALQPLNDLTFIAGQVKYNHRSNYTPILLVNIGLRFYFLETSEYDPSQKRTPSTQQPQQRNQTNQRAPRPSNTPRPTQKEPLKPKPSTKPPKVIKPKS